MYGATAHRSPDLGETWERAEGIGLPEESGLTWEKSWHVEPGHADEPETLWLGGTPGALFRSGDGGSTWEPVQSVIGHPTREKWNPGAGGLCCHSIQVDPSDPQRLYIAISAAGAFRSDDGGETWEPKNTGVAADFFPDDNFPEVGQCVHKLLVHPAQTGAPLAAEPLRRLPLGRPRRHVGAARGERPARAGSASRSRSIPPTPTRPTSIPEEGAENRVTPDGRLGVYRTGTAAPPGSCSRRPAAAGVASVMREGMSFDRLDPVGIYLGTQSGSVWVSPDAGGEWIEAAAYLPTILSVEAAEWP